ncbi:Long-chain-fatty-acid--CoA ligase [Methylobacterium crusticola]|uniref:Long-chain-fatty-acid--CoA ligase n=1 Tax=Methylobacterium crusticola TaxID=1697972 RepID=A0ABQ4R2X6_9HYPH|nr:malonyl-CoA synthase [Methylobacterium crusticola]GJD51186.1 Long-chain-fatty-acid--CoA ligase [Methylobacterium crusticola]
MSNHFFDLVRSRLPADPAGRLFLETPEGLRWSYADLVAASGRYAAALAGLGVRPGDRVAVQVEKSPAVIALYLGCVRAGAVFLPLNTAYTPAEIAYFLGDAEPALFVCDPARAGELRSVASSAGVAQVGTLDAAGEGTLAAEAAGQTGDFADVARAGDDLAAILYTSGTTGRSKGAMLTHDNLASNALTLVAYWRFTADDVLIHALPVFHTHGLFVATNTVLMAGAAMIFLPRLDAPLILSLMGRASALMGVPTFYTRLLKEPGLTREAARGMRLFVSGSAPLLAETHRAWQDRTGHPILERYGMTETNMSTSNPYDGDRVAGTVGFPLPGVSLRVVDPESGEPLGTDAVGMIEVRGPNVFKGYWRMPEKTAAEFKADGFFITGDLGKVDARGYVHIVGRGKDLIITGGYNVYPKEVEAEIDGLPGVLESAVIGLAHRDFGEGVTAVVVPRGDARPSEAEILGALQARLAKFKLPKRVLFVDELPRNTMGKVQKNLLRDAHKDLYGV